MRYVTAVIVLGLCSSVVAQTGPALLLKPLLSEKETWESRGNALFMEQGHTSNDESFKMNVFEASGRFREQREKFIPRLGWDLTYLDIDTDEAPLNNNLTDVSVAAGVELGTYYDFRAGLTVGVGYAGDSPFGESDAWYGKATLVMGKNLDAKTQLAFVLDYDGNRTFWPDVPLPGVAYVHEFDPTLSYTVGVPLSSVMWKPKQVENFSLEVTWVIIERFDARAEYKLSPAWRFYGALENRNQAFHIEGLEGQDRLLFQQRRAEMGITWQPLETTSFFAGIGYAFGGEFSSGWDQRDSTLIADISDEPYIRFGYERRF